MRILLLSMPDSFEHTPALAIRMPNGALASLAGNVDPHHHVAIADLVLAQCVGAADGRAADPRRAARRRRPVGDDLSARHRAADHLAHPVDRADGRGSSSAATIPSLAPDAWTHPAIGVDFIVRGEGDLTFRDLRARARTATCRCRRSPGSGTATGRRFQRNPPRPVASIEDGDDQAAEPRARACSPATRCSAARSTSSKPRAAAPTTAASARSSRCAAATSTASRSRASSTTSRDARRARRARRSSSSTTTSRSTSRGSRRCASAIIDARPQRHRLHRAGDDGADRRARRRRWRR